MIILKNERIRCGFCNIYYNWKWEMRSEKVTVRYARGLSRTCRKILILECALRARRWSGKEHRSSKSIAWEKLPQRLQLKRQLRVLRTRTRRYAPSCVRVYSSVEFTGRKEKQVFRVFLYIISSSILFEF